MPVKICFVIDDLPPKHDRTEKNDPRPPGKILLKIVVYFCSNQRDKKFIHS